MVYVLLGAGNNMLFISIFTELDFKLTLYN